jgi:hypothetical protein
LLPSGKLLHKNPSGAIVGNYTLLYDNSFPPGESNNNFGIFIIDSVIYDMGRTIISHSNLIDANNI